VLPSLCGSDSLATDATVGHGPADPGSLQDSLQGAVLDPASQGDCTSHTSRSAQGGGNEDVDRRQQAECCTGYSLDFQRPQVACHARQGLTASP